MRYFSRYVGTYIHTDRKTYIQKVSFYNIDANDITSFYARFDVHDFSADIATIKTDTTNFLHNTDNTDTTHIVFTEEQVSLSVAGRRAGLMV